MPNPSVPTPYPTAPSTHCYLVDDLTRKVEPLNNSASTGPAAWFLTERTLNIHELETGDFFDRRRLEQLSYEWKSDAERNQSLWVLLYHDTGWGREVVLDVELTKGVTNLGCETYLFGTFAGDFSYRRQMFYNFYPLPGAPPLFPFASDWLPLYQLTSSGMYWNFQQTIQAQDNKIQFRLAARDGETDNFVDFQSVYGGSAIRYDSGARNIRCILLNIQFTAADLRNIEGRAISAKIAVNQQPASELGLLRFGRRPWVTSGSALHVSLDQRGHCDLSTGSLDQVLTCFKCQGPGIPDRLNLVYSSESSLYYRDAWKDPKHDQLVWAPFGQGFGFTYGIRILGAMRAKLRYDTGIRWVDHLLVQDPIGRQTVFTREYTNFDYPNSPTSRFRPESLGWWGAAFGRSDWDVVLDEQPGGGYVLSAGDHSDEYLFASDGKLQRITTPGYARVLELTWIGNSFTVTDSSGRQTSYQDGAGGQIQTVTDPAGAVWTFVYDGPSLVELRSPLGLMCKLDYDPDNFVMRKRTDETGLVTTYDYLFTQTVDRRLLWGTFTKSDAAEPTRGQVTHRFDYQTAGTSQSNLGPDYCQISYTNPRNYVTAYAMNAWVGTYLSGLSPVTITAPDNSTQTVTYNNVSGKLLNHYFSTGRSISYMADDGVLRGINLSAPLEPSVGARYVFAQGNPRRLEKYIDELNKEESYQYVDKPKARDLLSQITRLAANGQPPLVVKYGWNDMGDMIEESETGDELNVFEYHTQAPLLGLKKKITHCAQSVTEIGEDEFEYDGYGNATMFKGAEGILRNEYDCFGELTKESHESCGVISTRTYVPSSDRKTVVETDFDGTAISMVFDCYGAVISITAIDQAGVTSSWAFKYDANGNKKEATQPNGEPIVMEYDPRDRLKKVMTSLGIDEYQYDPHGYLQQVTQTDSAGASQVTNYRFSAEGLLKRLDYPSVPLPDGSAGTWRPAVSLDYHPNGCAKKVTTGLMPGIDAEAEYELDEDGRPKSVKRKVGGSHYEVSQPLDGLGRLVEQGGPQYDWSGVPLTTTTAADIVTGDSGNIRSQLQFDYDCRNRLKSVLDRANQEVLRLDYTDNDGLKSVTSPDPSLPSGLVLRPVETRNYDTLGRESEIIAASGARTALDYDAESHIKTVTADNKATQEFGYDENGRVKTTTIKAPDVAPFSTTYRYAGNQLGFIEHTNRLSPGFDQLQSYWIDYDRFGRPSLKRDGLNRIYETRYNDFGDPERIIADGREIAFDYDSLHRLSSKTFVQSGEKHQYRYDGQGNLTFADSPVTQCRWRYDQLGRLLERSVTFKSVNITKTLHYQYDQFGNLFSRRDDEGYRLEFGFDEYGKLARARWKNAVIVSQTYNAAALPWTREYPGSGVTSTWDYDTSGWISGISHTKGGQPVSSFTYRRGKLGEVLEVQRQGRPQAGVFERDGLGRVTREQVTSTLHAAYRIDRVLDSIGNVAWERSSQSIRLIQSDVCNQISAVAEGLVLPIANADITLSVDSIQGSGFEAVNVLNGDVSDSLAAGIGWISDLADADHSIEWRFTAPRTLALIELQLPSTFGEATGLQLTVQAVAGGAWQPCQIRGIKGGLKETVGIRVFAPTVTIVLDAQSVAGLRLVRPQGLGFTNAPAGYHGALAIIESRLFECSLSTKLFSYNGLGCRTGQGPAVFQYDYEGRLTRVTDVQFDIEYRYGADGRVAERIDHRTGKVSFLLFDGTQLFAEYDEMAKPMRRYLLAPGEPAALGFFAGDASQAAWHHYLFDDRFNVTEVIDASGQIVNHYLYDPWGGILALNEAVPQPIRYMAHYYDEASRQYLWHIRNYDPSYRTFLQRDPLSGSAHAYAFLGNDPTTNADPLGLGWLPSWVTKTIDAVTETAKELPGALFEDFASGAARDRLSHFGTGIAKGGKEAMKAAVNGIVRVVTHPVETIEHAAEQINYTIWYPKDSAEQAWKGLKKGTQELRHELDRLMVLARDHPNAFAEEIGRLTGQAMVNAVLTRGAGAAQGYLVNGAVNAARKSAVLTRARNFVAPYSRAIRTTRCYWNNSTGEAAKGNFQLPRNDKGSVVRPSWPKHVKDDIKNQFPQYSSKLHDICHGVPATLMAHSIEKIVNSGVKLEAWLENAGFPISKYDSVERAATAFFYHRCTDIKNLTIGDRHLNRSTGAQMPWNPNFRGTNGVEQFVVDRAEALWAQGKTWPR